MTLSEELREALANMEERFGVTDSLLVVEEDPATGEWTDPDGDPVDKDDVEAGTVITLKQTLVIPREQAEDEARQILGPADVAASGDWVRVPPDWGSP